MDDHLETIISAVCADSVAVHGDVDAVVEAQVDRLAPLADDLERAAIQRRAVARLTGLDALEELLTDHSVDEVMVNRGTEIWVDRGGRTELAGDLPPGAAEVVLERVVAPLGTRLDRTSPIIDARLPSGARLCAVVPPVAIDGPTVSIRRHRHHQFGLDDFADPAVVDLLDCLMRSRANVLITGATSSGKTSLLAALLASTDPDDRIVVIEDTHELPLERRQTVRLEAQAGNIDGGSPIRLTDLVRTSLRLRPDRLVIGEFRGDEVVGVVEALNTGHDGSLSTCHANSAVDGLRRVETLVLRAAPTWPLAAIRAQVSRSIDAVVHVGRHPDGSRRVVEVAEVVESADEPAVATLCSGGRVLRAFARSRR